MDGETKAYKKAKLLIKKICKPRKNGEIVPSDIEKNLIVYIAGLETRIKKLEENQNGN